MWALDRFSNQNSSQSSLPPSRSYSPAPRRSNLGPGRPSLTPRDSSVLLASRSPSQSRLSPSLRLPVSTNREQATPSTSEVEEPLAALDRILGSSQSHAATRANGHNLATSISHLDIDVPFEGLSLQEYAERAIHATDDISNVLPYSQRSIEEYENESSKFEDLHKSITGCDDVLQSVEKYLSSFQADLAAVSAEIETLQLRSTSLNDRLDKRRTVEKQLSPLVDRVTIPPNIVKKISEGAIDEVWVRSLDELQQRSSALESAPDLESVEALKGLRPILEDLTNRAVERIRDYFASQIRALRSPNINAQIIQQQAFLRFQPLYAFLATKQPQLAEDVMQAYANTMRWYYHAQFTRYYSALSELKLFHTDKHDVLGEDPTTAVKAKGSVSAPAADNFILTRRIEVLRTPATAAMPSHAAEESKASHHLETPYLAYNLALIDNASFEHTFLSNFFTSQRAVGASTQASNLSTNQALVARHFNTIFIPIINMGMILTKTLITETFDALGVLILIRLTQHFAFTLQRRKVPTLDSYINGTNMLLWPRFQSILDANCASLRQLTASLPNRASGASNAAGTITSLSGSGGAPGSTAPHPVTQRFANLVRGVIDLSSEAADNEPVSNSLGRLRNEYERFLTKLGGSFGSGERGRREGKRLMANNYSLVLAVLGDAKGRLADATKTRFEELTAEAS